mmetsp:Transcript_22115/g.52606  ORF Transcript_22115/g.52606 Transcript_22115/m.52606 type:complete len:206 (-) Transcript_22115:154-771(-)
MRSQRRRRSRGHAPPEGRFEGLQDEGPRWGHLGADHPHRRPPTALQERESHSGSGHSRLLRSPGTKPHSGWRQVLPRSTADSVTRPGRSSDGLLQPVSERHSDGTLHELEPEPTPPLPVQAPEPQEPIADGQDRSRQIRQPEPQPVAGTVQEPEPAVPAPRGHLRHYSSKGQEEEGLLEEEGRGPEKGRRGRQDGLPASLFRRRH